MMNDKDENIVGWLGIACCICSVVLSATVGIILYAITNNLINEIGRVRTPMGKTGEKCCKIGKVVCIVRFIITGFLLVMLLVVGPLSTLAILKTEKEQTEQIEQTVNDISKDLGINIQNETQTSLPEEIIIDKPLHSITCGPINSSTLPVSEHEGGDGKNHSVTVSFIVDINEEDSYDEMIRLLITRLSKETFASCTLEDARNNQDQIKLIIKDKVNKELKEYFGHEMIENVRFTDIMFQ